MTKIEQIGKRLIELTEKGVLNWFYSCESGVYSTVYKAVTIKLTRIDLVIDSATITGSWIDLIQVINQQLRRKQDAQTQADLNAICTTLDIPTS